MPFGEPRGALQQRVLDFTVESLVGATDSVVFYPATVTLTNAASWYLEDSIRIGCAASDFTNAKPWISLSSAAQLLGAKGNCHYFQNRIALVRKPFSMHPDSLLAPSITGITIPWDAQPQVVSIDSVFVNGVHQQTINFDSTVQIRSRSDSLRVAFACRDTDPGDTLYLRTTSPSRDTLLKLAPPAPYEASVRFNPIVLSNTTAQCSVSVRDPRNWTSVVRHFFIRTQQPTADSCTLPEAGRGHRCDFRADRSSAGGFSRVFLQRCRLKQSIDFPGLFCAKRHGRSGAA